MSGVAETNAGPAGSAALIAGHDEASGDKRSSVTFSLGRVGEILLAANPTWYLRRLSPGGDGDDAPHRVGIKRALDQLHHSSVPAALIALAATVHETPSGPALVTAAGYREYPEDATLPLAWLGERLAALAAEHVVAVLSLRAADRATSPQDAARWLAALAARPSGQLIAVHAPSAGDPAIEVLANSLLGEAIDPSTGTITLRQLGEQLLTQLPSLALRSTPAGSTFCVAPPLGRRLDLGWSRHHRRAAPTDERPTGIPAAAELAGATLPGRIRIDSVIARGSSGVVYRARQLAVEREVAVKVLLAGVDPDSEDGRLFVNEIQAVGRIDHPNVVRIHQADITHDGRLFFAMELLGGRDLQAELDAGVLPQPRAVALVRQLLAGLGAAHEAGLVHADIKPANAVLVPAKDGERLVLIDFGLSRLRPPGADQSAESAGGTPAYMAPEQLRKRRVDARSDIFSAALVLVALLTGRRRRSRSELVPPLDDVTDPALRATLLRALAIDPAERYPTAAALAAALAGEAEATLPAAPPPPPFRRLAPFTEEDRGRFFGRDRELQLLTEQALYRRVVLLTAPSGTGKTSLLRSGLVPRLEALNVHPHYRSCRLEPAAVVAELTAPSAARRVLILDQLEAVEENAEPFADPITTLLALGASSTWPTGLSVILSIREDHLARVMGRLQPLEDLALTRLGPLTREGAKEAIVRPLAEHRLTIEPDLLEKLLIDLEAATAALGPELGWGRHAGIYPPHLQLACSVLYEALETSENTLTLAHYHHLGGLEAIVGEHLDRVLDTELPAGDAAIARDLFLALVTAGQARAARSEAELSAMVGSVHGQERVTATLEALRSHGLLVRVRRKAGEPVWELIHDSLVPRVLGWIDRRDLSRRQAIEQLRHHLRRSQPAAPSLLTRAELRELRAHPGAIAALDEEWAPRALEPEAWTPSKLVARSQQVAQRTMAATLGLSALVLTALSAAGIDRWIAADDREREQSLRDRDQGRFILELAPFDWDPTALTTTPVQIAKLPELTWTLHEPDPEEPTQPGLAIAPSRISRGKLAITPDGVTRVERVEAPGGPAFLLVEGRGAQGARCAPSVIPLRALPGYASRLSEPKQLRIPVPTCQATLVDTIEIPAGKFIRGGIGEPPAPKRMKDPALAQESVVDLPSFRIDRTELTNAALAPLVSISALTGLSPPFYVQTPELANAGDPRMPVTNVTWERAKIYCSFFGKRLPTSEEWEKAFRGGLTLPDGSINPFPRRTTAWGTAEIVGLANIYVEGRLPRISAIGAFPKDRSPHGLLDLTGNASEWIAINDPSETRYIRGGSWGWTTSADFTDYTASDNPRPPDAHDYTYGLRCVAGREERGVPPATKSRR